MAKFVKATNWKEKKKSKLSVRRVIVNRMKELIGRNKNDDEIMEELDLSLNELRYYRQLVFKVDAEELRETSTEESYLAYCIKQRENLRELDKAIKNFQGSRQYNALVGAIKAKSDILNDMVDKGQALGFLDKVPDRLQVLAGIQMKDMSSNEMRDKLEEYLLEIKGMAGELKGKPGEVLDTLLDEVEGMKNVTPALPPAKGKKQFSKD
jgi:hypothetical protein